MPHTNPVLSLPHIHSEVANRFKAKAKQVDQLSLAHSLPVTELSTNELCSVLLNRFNTSESIGLVPKDTLFKLFVTIDSELELRADDEQYADSYREDNYVPSDYRSTWSDDELTEAQAVRNIHAECFDDGEEEY